MKRIGCGPGKAAVVDGAGDEFSVGVTKQAGGSRRAFFAASSRSQRSISTGKAVWLGIDAVIERGPHLGMIGSRKRTLFSFAPHRPDS